MANAFNNFFITITGKLNIQQIEKGDAVSVLQHSFLVNLPSIKTILDKKYNIFPKAKYHQVMMK